MFVLGTGRERARRQLEQRTGQLHHQALHDALTGMPNRALVMDRIEQMLARDRRHHTTGAALFLDLDDFKNVNDTLGHGAGDRLLIAVAERLAAPCAAWTRSAGWAATSSSCSSTAPSLDVAPELVAQRLLDVMRQPFELDDASMPLTVNVSIGIASGDRGQRRGPAPRCRRRALPGQGAPARTATRSSTRRCRPASAAVRSWSSTCGRR